MMSEEPPSLFTNATTVHCTFHHFKVSLTVFNITPVQKKVNLAHSPVSSRTIGLLYFLINLMGDFRGGRLEKAADIYF